MRQLSRLTRVRITRRRCKRSARARNVISALSRAPSGLSLHQHNRRTSSVCCLCNQESEMNTTEMQMNEVETPNAAVVAMKLEVVVIPVSDVDRAKEFYSKLGWRLDADRAVGDTFRLVQLTAPG